MEAKMNEANQADVMLYMDRDYLECQLIEQQIFQKDIERDGAVLVAALRKDEQIYRTTKKKNLRGGKLAFLERRWHELWLKSLERHCRIEQKLLYIRLDTHESRRSESTDRSTEPRIKRQRLNDEEKVVSIQRDHSSSCISDTIPFAEEEYESIMDRESPILDDNGNLVQRTATASDYSSDTGAGRYRVPIMDQENRKLKQLLERSRDHYSKLTPLDSDGVTDTDTPRITAPSACFNLDLDSDHVSRSTSPAQRGSCMDDYQELTDFLQQSPRDYDDILGMLDQIDPLDRNESLDQDRPVPSTNWITLESKKIKSKRDEDSQYPSCDASSELSVDESRNFHSSSRTLLQGSADLKTSTPAARRKFRKRRMPRTASLTKSLPASASENAIMMSSFSSSITNASPPTKWDIMTSSMSSSGYGGCGTSMEHSSSYSTRKTLTAHRRLKLLRSMSDGENLMFLKPTYRVSSNDVRIRRDTDEAIFGEEDQKELELPLAPRASPISDEEEHECIDQLDSGYRDQDLSTVYAMVSMQETDDILDDGERTAGDGGSTVSGADQSEIGNYEWDDYKPPKHNENGPDDQSELDGKNLIDWEQMSDSYSSTGPTSARMKFTVGHDGLSTLESARLPPVGLSQDSDSELEEMHRLVNESHRQLRSAHAALKQRQKNSRSSYVDLLSICEKNIQRLEEMVGRKRRGIGQLAFNVDRRGSGNGDVDELLASWKDLVIRIKKCWHGNTRIRTLSAEEEDEFVNVLRQELRRFGESLSDIMAQGIARFSILNGSDATDSCRTLDELNEAIDFHEALQQRIRKGKKRLDDLRQRQSEIAQISKRSHEMDEDVEKLKLDYHHACIRCERQLRQLKGIREPWSQWEQMESDCKQLLYDVHANLGQSELLTILQQSNRTNQASASACEAFKSDLFALADRVYRLEKFYNELATTARVTLCLDQSILDEMKDRTTSITLEFDRLKAKLKSAKDAVDGQQCTECSETEAECGVENEKSFHEPQSTENDRQAANRHVLIRFWPLQLCLLIVLILDVFLFYPACCEHVNRYWFTFGPQIYYSNGPPPT